MWDRRLRAEARSPRACGRDRPAQSGARTVRGEDRRLASVCVAYPIPPICHTPFSLYVTPHFFCRFVPRDPLVDEVVDDGAHLSAHVSGDTGSVSDQDDGSVSDEDDGYVLSFVYDPLAHTSQLVILDAKHVGGEPVATVALEQHVPMFFHGCWVPEHQMELIGQLDSNE